MSGDAGPVQFNICLDFSDVLLVGHMSKDCVQGKDTGLLCLS